MEAAATAAALAAVTAGAAAAATPAPAAATAAATPAAAGGDGGTAWSGQARDHDHDRCRKTHRQMRSARVGFARELHFRGPARFQATIPLQQHAAQAVAHSSPGAPLLQADLAQFDLLYRSCAAVQPHVRAMHILQHR
eukprot:4146969-Pleurochrysis_carterae.AAC.1